METARHRGGRCTVGTQGERAQDWKHDEGMGGAGRVLVGKGTGETKRLKNAVPRNLHREIKMAAEANGVMVSAKRVLKWTAMAMVGGAEAAQSGAHQDSTHDEWAMYWQFMMALVVLVAACRLTLEVMRRWQQGDGGGSRQRRRGTTHGANMTTTRSAVCMVGILLLTMVVGTQAKGDEHDSGGCESVAAATVGTGLWVAEEARKWVGDNILTDRKPGRYRLAGMNLNGFSLCTDPEAQLGMWDTLNRHDVDGMAMQDHRCGSKDHGVVKSYARISWATDEPSKWAWTNSPSNEASEGTRCGGTCLAVKGDVVSRVVKMVEDETGLNRFSGMVLKGKGGCHMMVLSVYLPTRSDGCRSMWQVQREWLLTKTVSEQGRANETTSHFERATDPWYAALDAVMGAVDAAPANTKVVLQGDINMPWDDTGRPRPLTGEEKRCSKALRKACEERGMCSLWHKRHVDKRAWTRSQSFPPQGDCSHIDLVLMSESMLEPQYEVNMAICEGEQHNRSDHRMVITEWNMDAVMGLQAQHKHKRKRCTRALSLKDTKSVLEFAHGVADSFGANAEQELVDLEHAVWQLGDSGDADAGLMQKVQDWGQHVQTIIDTERKMVERRNAGSSRRRKDGWSTKVVNLRQKLRKMELMLIAAKQGKYTRTRRLWKQGHKEHNKWVRHTPMHVNDMAADAEHWKRWCGEVQQVVNAKKTALNGRLRNKMRRAMGEWVAEKEAAYEKAECKHILAQDLGKPRRAPPLEEVIVHRMMVPVDG